MFIRWRVFITNKRVVPGFFYKFTVSPPPLQIQYLKKKSFFFNNVGHEDPIAMKYLLFKYTSKAFSSMTMLMN